MGIPLQVTLERALDGIESDQLPITLTNGGAPSHVIDCDDHGWFVARLEMNRETSNAAREAAVANSEPWMPEQEWAHLAPGDRILTSDTKSDFVDQLREWWPTSGSMPKPSPTAAQTPDSAPNSKQPSRGMAIIHQFIAYAVAIAISTAAGWVWHESVAQNLLLTVFVADVVGTIVVFGFSRFHDNSSFYDPYWSVAPMVIAAAYVWIAPVTTNGMALAVLAVMIWGARLTFNFLSGWTGLDHEDWRYVDFREQFPRAYWWVSFGGVHMFPTLLVFAGCLPLYAAFFERSEKTSFWVQLIGVAIMFIATGIEALSDRQLRNFIRSNPPRDAIMERGLWRYSRHPNYFGELSFWWGIWIFGFGVSPDNWHWTLAGPISMTLLFVFVSIPLLDKRSMKRRAGYAAHMKRVSGLVPLPRRSD